MSVSIALLQAALGGAFLLILFLILVAGVVVIAAISGGALSDRDSQVSSVPIVPPGTVLAASGLGLAVLGALYSLSLAFVGIILGMMAYYRGARVLGGVATVLSFVAIFVGVYLGIATGPSPFSI